MTEDLSCSDCYEVPAPSRSIGSQDPEVEQHSSSTLGPTIKRQAETEPTDTTKQARVSLHDNTKLARLRLLDPFDDDHTSSSNLYRTPF
jgi:hypothetical protein